jgi:hypothetical protein
VPVDTALSVFLGCWKDRIRLLSQPPFSFLFVQKWKKTVLTKNPLANDVKKHVGLIFSPAGETLIPFSDIQTVVPLKGFLRFATKCDIACDKMRQNAILHATNAISHFVAFCCILLHFVAFCRMRYRSTLMLLNSYPTKMVITLTLTLPNSN